MIKSVGHFHFLGTGASMGIPVIGCHCHVCSSPLHYNKRLRPSALCTIGEKQFLIDCGPDFKQQALLHKIEALDGVIFTHAHNDHTAGIDDLKIYSLKSGNPLPCLCSPETKNDIEKRFYYLFQKGPYSGSITQFETQFLEERRGSVDFQGVHIGYFSYEQMGMIVNGYRFGDLAYISDIKHYPSTIFEDLRGVHTLILSALRFTTSQMHFSVDEAIDFAAKAGAHQTWLMHISHEMDHEKANAYLPENIRVAYDGLRLEFQAELCG
jgi:phosphoribosyl 1,2-cyclic phosphate phosphodiesterase